MAETIALGAEEAVSAFSMDDEGAHFDKNDVN